MLTCPRQKEFVAGADLQRDSVPMGRILIRRAARHHTRALPAPSERSSTSLAVSVFPTDLARDSANRASSTSSSPGDHRVCVQHDGAGSQYPVLRVPGALKSAWFVLPRVPENGPGDDQGARGDLRLSRIRKNTVRPRGGHWKPNTELNLPYTTDKPNLYSRRHAFRLVGRTSWSTSDLTALLGFPCLKCSDGGTTSFLTNPPATF